MEPSIEINKPLPAYGDLIKRSFSDAFSKPEIFALLAGFSLVTGVVNLLLEKTDLGLPVVAALALVSLALALLNIVATIVVIKSLANPLASIRDLWNESLPQFWSYWWLMIVYTVIILSGFMLLLVPGIILMGYLYLTLNVTALEGIKGLDAMVRSTSLIKGNWWAVAFRTSVVVFLMFLAVLAFGLVFGILIGIIAPFLGFGDFGMDLATVVVLEPLIAAASMIIVLSATNQIYQSLQGVVVTNSDFEAKTRRLYKALAIIGPIVLIGSIFLMSYLYIEYGFMGGVIDAVAKDPVMYE
jgi:hypothetical protein